MHRTGARLGLLSADLPQFDVEMFNKAFPRYQFPENHLFISHHFSGLLHLSLGNLAKSPSVDMRVQPCCTASAARCASVTRLPSACPSMSKPCSTAQCRSVDVMIRVHG